MQSVVLDVQRMTTEPAAMREQHAGRTRFGQVDNCSDRKGTITKVDGDGFRYLGSPWTVDVPVARRSELGARRGEEFDTGPIIQWQSLIGTGLVEPQPHELGQPAGFFIRKVPELGSVDLRGRAPRCLPRNGPIRSESGAW
ncbi:hypothetical protein GCM10020255_055760 [Rhodococcus baikonurensis]